MGAHNVSRTAIAAAGFAAGLFAANGAQATEGYFQPGYSAIQKSLAGTGVADPQDAMTLAVNPAGLTSVGQEFEVDLSLFSPMRHYTVTGGPGFVASGTVDSTWNYFVIPGLAYSQPIDANSSWGFAMYGNGGMNTNYQANSLCGLGGPGVFCGGEAGVNLNQLFISAGYAWRSGNWSFGVAPILAVQMFDAIGLAAFSGLSSSPGNLTNRGIDYSYGGGVRAGLMAELMPGFRLAVAGSTPMWMSNFDKYKGLFAEQGGFNIPPSVTAGLAWDVAADWTLMADYKHIFYSSVTSVGRSMTVPNPLGASNGPGFGWSDVDVISVGAEWRATPEFALRAGYAHNTNPVGPEDVTLNILAPGVVTDHIATGFSYRFGQNSILDFSGMYVPEHSVSGIEVTPMGPNPGRTITLAMHQWDLTLGYRYKF
jgi:long-chain fatty acid transport protein